MEKKLYDLNIQLFANDELNDVFKMVNEVLKDANVDDVTAETSEKFTSLPDGYYYTEVDTAELAVSNASGNPMVRWVFTNVEDGITLDEDGELTYINGTKGKKHFVYSSLKDGRAVERFVSDALKFEGEEPGVPYLDKEYFTTAETLNDAIGLLEGRRIWLHVDTSENDDGSSSVWTRLVSFKRAIKLGLETE